LRSSILVSLTKADSQLHVLHRPALETDPFLTDWGRNDPAAFKRYFCNSHSCKMLPHTCSTAIFYNNTLSYGSLFKGWATNRSWTTVTFLTPLHSPYNLAWCSLAQGSLAPLHRCCLIKLAETLTVTAWSQMHQVLLLYRHFTSATDQVRLLVLTAVRPSAKGILGFKIWSRKVTSLQFISVVYRGLDYYFEE